MENSKLTTLDNGVRIITESVGHVGSASVGIWCQTGSSHELENEAGITHFIEHMLFKGTKNRTSQQIAESIEGKGGVLNAFTDKEQTCYYCHVLATDASNGLDVLADMVRNSELDPKELETEKGVVLEEIKRGEDEPGDHVHDLHMQGCWDGHQLGLPVIGTAESVSSFSQDDLKKYMDRRYFGSNLIVSVAGNIQHDDVVNVVGKLLGDIPLGERSEALPEPTYHPGTNLVNKDVQQVHFCIGTQGCSYYSNDFYTQVVLDSILGGGMSSRLFQEVREKRGLVYAIGSYSATYTAGGTFTIYGGTSMQLWEELQNTVRAELDKMMSDGPTEHEIARIKQQISGNMVLGLEGMGARQRRMAKNEIVFGRQVPIEETLEKINKVTHADLKNLAGRMFDKDQMRMTAIGSFG